MLKEIRNAIAAIVEAVSGLSETVGSDELPPGLGWFRVRPLGLPGFGNSGNARIMGEVPFALTLAYVAAPNEPVRLGEIADSVEAVRAALNADIDASVNARLGVDDAVFDYGTPGYVTVTMDLTAYTLLTT